MQIMEPLSTGVSYLQQHLQRTTSSSVSANVILLQVPPFLVAICTVTLCLLLLILAYIYAKRRATQRLLEAAGLPTVFWTPRFWTYDDYHTTAPADGSTNNNNSMTITQEQQKQQANDSSNKKGD